MFKLGLWQHDFGSVFFISFGSASFFGPHCGTPYIDYRKYPQNKVFGVSGCVHLGHKYIRKNRQEFC